MPIYEYYCPLCQSVIEISHPMANEPTILCENCHQKRIKKMSVGAVTFRGGGWGSSPN